MANTIGRILLLVCIAGCEHADSIGSSDAPLLGPGVGPTIENTELTGEWLERVEPPPPPTRLEMRESRLRQWFSLLSMEAQRGVTAMCHYNLENPCAGLLIPAGRPWIDPRPQMLSALGGGQKQIADHYCKAVVGHEICDTPLVVAFEGEAIAFTNHWPTAVTPWLALDRDGDGAITSRAELFGDATVLADGRTAKNGFEALAVLDANADGVIDARDATFARLVLWADRDGDRRSSAGELRPAYEVVISIPLANEMRGRCTAAGDCEGEVGALQWRGPDGSTRTGAVVDVYLPRR